MYVTHVHLAGETERYERRGPWNSSHAFFYLGVCIPNLPFGDIQRWGEHLVDCLLSLIIQYALPVMMEVKPI